MTTAVNPLLSDDFSIPFDRIGPEHVVPGVNHLLAAAKAAVDAVAADVGAPTYGSVLGALEEATEELERAVGIVGHLEAVATSDALRAAYDEVKPAVSAFYSALPLNADLYRRLIALAESTEASDLVGGRARHLEKTVAEFKRHGAELDAPGKERLSEIAIELTKLTTKYAQNVLDSTNAFELLVEDEEELAGLPPSAVAAARQSAEAKGQSGYRFTLQAPSFIPVLTYLDDRAIREKIWRAYSTGPTSGEHDNRDLVRSILRLRREKAELLSFRNFADLVLADRMAKMGQTAESFIGKLRERTLPWFERENTTLEAYRNEKLGDDAPQLRPWDVAYWSEKQRAELYDFDEEELRPYFSVDAVLRGLFETVQRLYGVSIECTDDMPVWHETVRTYRFLDADGTMAGAFYIDLYPRESKRGGAWMQDLVTGLPPNPHLGLFCANVTPPVGDQPALLTHREVETLFHEFGHLMHHLLSKVTVRSLAGTNVAWDFVELPSQIMENWCWEREALDVFAHHHQTDEAIPGPLFDKMIRARTYRAAAAQMRQLGLGAVDLALHVEWDPSDDSAHLLEYAREILGAHSVAPLPEDYAMICRFGHLFASPVGYAAGYYSYKWAEVLDADAFTRFKEHGVFDPAIGAAFRDHILSQGDSRDPMELYQDFMGREPRMEPLFKRQGLV
ncbi:MAG: M3 family metallopeptidase [Deltaproteobacteria bacterium]|nr:M3 family metallopeptidase [Deltaproteobacteria bacterium]